MKLKNILPVCVLSAVLLLLWQSIVQLGYISSIILPAPTDIFQAVIANWDIILPHMLQTLLEVVVGLIIATLLGLLTAVLLDISFVVRKAIYPLLVTSQTIPLIALAPLLLIWFGFGLWPKVIIVVISCYFPVTVATIDGFEKIDPELTKLLKSMRASYWQSLFLVRLPGAMPQFFSGMKLAATYSVTAAIVGEYVGAYQGLGIYMQEMAHAHAIALVFGIIFIVTILTLLLFLLVALIEKIALPWYKKG